MLLIYNLDGQTCDRQCVQLKAECYTVLSRIVAPLIF